MERRLDLNHIPLLAERQAELEKIKRIVALDQEVNKISEDLNKKLVEARERIERENPAAVARLSAITEEQRVIEATFNGDLPWQRREDDESFPICLVSGLLILDTDLVVVDEVTGGWILRSVLFGPDPQVEEDEPEEAVANGAAAHA